MPNHTEERDIIDIVGINQTFCSGLASVEVTKGGIAHLVFYSEQRSLGRNGGLERLVIARLVMTHGALFETLGKLNVAMATAMEDAPPFWSSQQMEGRA